MPQSSTQVQFTPIPPVPTCGNPNAIFTSAACRDLWAAYNQAVSQRQQEEAQLEVNHQKEVAASEATAPLQQQIAALNKLVSDQQTQVKSLQAQIQVDSATALKATAEAHTQGLEQGAGVGVAGTLLLLGAIFAIRRVMRNFTVTKKPQTRAASA